MRGAHLWHLGALAGGKLIVFSILNSLGCFFWKKFQLPDDLRAEAKYMVHFQVFNLSNSPLIKPLHIAITNTSQFPLMILESSSSPNQYQINIFYSATFLLTRCLFFMRSFVFSLPHLAVTLLWARPSAVLSLLQFLNAHYQKKMCQRRVVFVFSAVGLQAKQNPCLDWIHTDVAK